MGALSVAIMAPVMQTLASVCAMSHGLAHTAIGTIRVASSTVARTDSVRSRMEIRSVSAIEASRVKHARWMRAGPLAAAATAGASKASATAMITGPATIARFRLPMLALALSVAATDDVSTARANVMNSGVDHIASSKYLTKPTLHLSVEFHR